MKPAIATLLALAGLLVATAQAAEPETATLACEGMATDMMRADAMRYPKSIGIVINLTTGVVHIPSINGPSIEIIRDASDELNIIFSGLDGTSGQTFTGHVNRVTGDMMATDSKRDLKTGKILSAMAYAMKCNPTVTMNKPASEYAE
jgi:hypothetical protein